MSELLNNGNSTRSDPALAASVESTKGREVGSRSEAPGETAHSANATGTHQERSEVKSIEAEELLEQIYADYWSL